MAYYLTVKEKNNFKQLDVSTLEEFSRLSKFKDASYSLDELDLFTSNFEDELSLKEILYSNGIITKEDILKEITIRRKNKNQLEKVMYGLVYKNNSKYLDVHYLRAEILGLQNDKVFLNKLLNHYRNSYKQEHLAKIRAVLEGYQDSDVKMDEALTSFMIDEVFETSKETGLVKIKYKSLHDLAMFVCNYLEDGNKKITNSDLEELQDKLIKPKQPVKIRKIRTEVQGQLSFF